LVEWKGSEGQVGRGNWNRGDEERGVGRELRGIRGVAGNSKKEMLLGNRRAGKQTGGK